MHRYPQDHFDGYHHHDYHGNGVSKRPTYEETIYGVNPRHMKFGDLEGGVELPSIYPLHDVTTPLSVNADPSYEQYHLAASMWLSTTPSPVVMETDAREGYSHAMLTMHDRDGYVDARSQRYGASYPYSYDHRNDRSSARSRDKHNLRLQHWPNSNDASDAGYTNGDAQSPAYEAKKRLRELAQDEARIDRLQKLLEDMKRSKYSYSDVTRDKYDATDVRAGAKMAWELIYPRRQQKSSLSASMNVAPRSVTVSSYPPHMAASMMSQPHKPQPMMYMAPAAAQPEMNKAPVMTYMAPAAKPMEKPAVMMMAASMVTAAPAKKKKNPYKTAIDIKKTSHGTVIDITHKAEEKAGAHGVVPMPTAAPSDELKLRMNIMKDPHEHDMMENSMTADAAMEKSQRMKYFYAREESPHVTVYGQDHEATYEAPAQLLGNDIQDDPATYYPGYAKHPKFQKALQHGKFSSSKFAKSLQPRHGEYIHSDVPRTDRRRHRDEFKSKTQTMGAYDAATHDDHYHDDRPQRKLVDAVQAPQLSPRLRHVTGDHGHVTSQYPDYDYSSYNKERPTTADYPNYRPHRHDTGSHHHQQHLPDVTGGATSNQEAPSNSRPPPDFRKFPHNFIPNHFNGPRFGPFG